MKKITLLLALLLLMGTVSANAQFVVAEDNAGNYSTWADADNLGFGFGEWDLWNNASSGWFIGSSSGAGFGNIDSNSKSFGLWGTTGYANAQRLLNAHWGDGATFTIDLATAYRSGARGIDLFASGFDQVWNFNIGSDQYTAGGVNQSWAYSQQSIFKLTVVQEGANLQISLTRGTDTYSTTITGKTLYAFKLYCGGTTGGDLNNLFFNNVKVSYSDWSKVPSDIKVKVAGNAALNADKTVSELEIASGETTLEAGNQLTVGTLTNNGMLTLKTGATVLTSSVGGSGTTYVEQTLPSGRQWWYLASPLSGATSNVIRPDGSANLMTHYDEATFNYSTAYAANSATPLVAGRGYVVKFSDANERTVVFTGGSLNNGEVALTPTRTGTTAGKRGFNLIGNPYPSYLNWDAVYTDATNPALNMRNAIWFRTMDGVMKFHTYSDGEGVPSLDANDNPLTITGQIAPMQAFWVKVQADPLAPETVSNGSLTFKNTHRSHQAATGYNPLKAKAAELRPRVRLVISNGVADDEMLVVGKSYAANGLDSYDIEKLSNDNAAIPELFSLVENQELVINSMQELKAGKWVMLGMRPGVAGNFGIKVSQLENIDAQVMLIDRLLNTEQELTLGETYSFTSDGTATNDRFSLEFRAPGTITSVDELATEAHVFVNENRQLIVQAPGITRNDRISVYTLAGQQLQLQQADGAVTVLSRPLTTGVYIVKVNQLVEKVIVK